MSAKKYGCGNCGGKGVIQMPCRVCELLDNDSSVKNSTFCSICGVYICLNDITNPIRRAKAALIDLRLKLTD